MNDFLTVREQADIAKDEQKVAEAKAPAVTYEEQAKTLPHEEKGQNVDPFVISGARAVPENRFRALELSGNGYPLDDRLSDAERILDWACQHVD